MTGRLYDTSRWRERRARQLAAQPLCRLCVDVLDRVTAATVADHVVPHRGDPEKFFHGELQSLCASCHSSLKQQIENGGGMRAVCLHGLPLDPLHPWSADGGCKLCRRRRFELAGGTFESTTDSPSTTGASPADERVRTSPRQKA